MRADLKAGLLLVITFAMGAAAGALGAGMIAQRGAGANLPDRPPDGRGRPGGGPRGFVEDMDAIIEPSDFAQRAALRPFLEATDRQNRAIVAGARGSMHVAMDSLRVKIAPFLNASQLQRFDEFVRRPAPNRAEPPGLDNGGRRGRAPGDRPPPGGRPPPPP